MIFRLFRNILQLKYTPYVACIYYKQIGVEIIKIENSIVGNTYTYTYENTKPHYKTICI